MRRKPVSRRERVTGGSTGARYSEGTALAASFPPEAGVLRAAAIERPESGACDEIA
ncbi:hypothetical protein G5647_06865 [Pectobacterium carotovorum]|uniref:hypothetical protein n=1 Tax=Pectobacterium TaxID=122277 RepID=UPI00191D811F|nr:MULTISPECIES: hypothetical protein [Pectobacterium]MBL0866141.1 hypothetical protein [Pectobacterium carotovorum]MCO4312853.1 hypothetical protein [Pectobacterium versatile]